MSRVGKHPVAVPKEVQVALNGQQIRAKGPKGELARTLSDLVVVTVEAGQIKIGPRDKSRRARAMWGTERNLVRNMVEGVTKGYVRNLEIQGVGYRSNVQGQNLVLQLGFSHEVTYPIPKGVEVKVDKQTLISISGADRRQVGQVAADIRGFRGPEPYKGKGIRYSGEKVLRKEGKKK